MPTDFSFVSDEGWDALKPKFERAEKKLDDKVRRKELTEDQARRMKDLMWKKYEHWAQGKGMKEKENQTVFQDKKPKKASAMSREARIGRTQLIDILNAITDGTIQNPAVFGQTLELNKITPQEFFDLMAQDVVRYQQLYPRQYIGYISELFTDWGYEAEVKKVVDQARGAVGPKPPESYSRPQTPPPAAPGATSPQPSPKPAAPAPQPKPEPAVPGESIESLAPKPDQFKVEPQPWPEKITPPKPSAAGKDTFRWYLQFVLPGEQAPRAAIVDGVNRQDMLDFIHQTEKSGQMKFRIAKPITQVNSPAQAPAAPAPAPAAVPAKAPAAAPAPAAEAPAEDEKQVVGEIDTPDPKDPVTYRWYLKYRLGSGHETAVSPDFTGIQMIAMMKRLEAMSIKILEMKKMSIAPKASLTIDDSDIRLAGEGDPVEKFRNGTPIIFTEDVNLEFDALSARGQIKKNMTGKIKKVEDNDYLIDIAGQLYRVPRLVAEHVMDVFAANVVPHPEEAAEQGPKPGQQPGQKPAAPAPAQPEKAQAPAAKPQAPAPGQNQGQLPPGGAPRMPAGMAGIVDRIVVADGDGEYFAEMGMDADAQTQHMRERNPCDVCPHMSSAHDFSDEGNFACQLCAQEGGPCATGYPENGAEPDPILSGADGRIVVADFEIEAAMNNKMLARAFADGATSGRGSHMFIDGDTIYSYGRHFPIATRGADGTVYLTTKTYSVSTARQISHVRNALHDFVYSDQTADGKVLKPTPQEIANREKSNAEAEAKRQRLDEKRKLRDQKKITQKRNQVPEERAQDIAETENKNLDDEAFIQQHDEKGRPIKYRIDRTLAPSTLEETPSLTPEQWMSRIDDIEGQLLRETDPARQEKLRQRLERMKQASWQQAMTRLAMTENPIGGEKADFADLQEVIRGKDRNTSKDQPAELKEHALPHQKKAAVQTQGFADLLMMIEKGGPNIPSEIGKRLYRADGAVSRVSA